ncbi:MAG: hypothetical protein ACTTKZ_05190 [Bacteroides sp.]
MRFNTTILALSEAWTYLQRIPLRPFISDGNVVRAEGNTLTITLADTEIIMRVQIPEVEVYEEGEVSFPLRLVMTAITSKNFDKNETVVFSTEPSGYGDQVKVNVSVNGFDVSLEGKSSSYIQVIEEWQEEQETNTLTLTEDVLKTGLEYTSFAALASSKNGRASFQCILFEIKENTINFVATDGSNLGYVQCSGMSDLTPTRICLPIRAMENLLNCLRERSESQVTLSYSERFATFQTEDFVLITRVLESVFPDYNTACPRGELHEIVVSRAEVIRTIDFFAPFCVQKDLPMVITIADNLMDFYISQSSIVPRMRKQIACQTQDETPLRISITMSALKKAFEHISSDDVLLVLPEPYNNMDSRGSAYIKPTIGLNENIEYWQLITLASLVIEQNDGSEND